MSTNKGINCALCCYQRRYIQKAGDWPPSSLTCHDRRTGLGIFARAPARGFGQSPCVLNAAGGASDTPVATPRGPYRVKDNQNSRFLRARALSKMTVADVFNAHYFRRSRNSNGLAVDKRLGIRARCMHSPRRFHPVVILCTPWVGWMPRKRKGSSRGEATEGRVGGAACASQILVEPHRASIDRASIE
jgi:hypothetical protein